MSLDNLYLTCPFHWLTGLDCPLCGLQRAIVALLHLHPVEAFWYNPWLAVLVPYCAILLAASVSERIRKLKFLAWCNKERTMLGMLILTILWGILRNLPSASFSC